jgi:hypothetical protein
VPRVDEPVAKLVQVIVDLGVLHVAALRTQLPNDLLADLSFLCG